MTGNTPWPIPDRVTQPFWDAVAEGRLLLQYCPDCGSWQFYPRAFCVKCLSDRVEWRESSGTGVVHSMTVARRAVSPAFEGRVPLVVALVDLAEGPRLMTNILVEEPTQVAIGSPVRMRVTEVADGVHLPTFAPIDDK